MLEQDHFLCECLWIVQKAKVLDVLIMWVYRICLLLDVVKVKKVGIKDNLRWVIEEHSIRFISKLVSYSIFTAKVHIFRNQYVISSILDQVCLGGFNLRLYISCWRWLCLLLGRCIILFFDSFLFNNLWSLLIKGSWFNVPLQRLSSSLPLLFFNYS
jgi:hypothetical protein